MHILRTFYSLIVLNHELEILDLLVITLIRKIFFTIATVIFFVSVIVFFITLFTIQMKYLKIFEY